MGGLNHNLKGGGCLGGDWGGGQKEVRETAGFSEGEKKKRPGVEGELNGNERAKKS